MSKGLGGAFAWDSTMDSIENGKFTYELTHQMADSVNSCGGDEPTSGYNCNGGSCSEADNG